ncbi:MAG: hypothetical protein KC912_04785 [Proteobacteria bacterium]|nr:hypothetical protein [Pseudomonadota bacterium]
MRHLFGLLLLAACSSGTPEDSERTYDPNPPDELGGDREAAVVLPDDYDITRTYPLVISLHGYGANATLQDVIFGLTPAAEAGDMILVKPEGTTNAEGKQFWNAATECCDFENTDVDDIGYLAGLIEEARELYPISHAAFVGHSNGGFMSYRMACERPDLVDRIAPLAGTLSPASGECPGTEPVRVLHMHGTDDDTIAYENTMGHLGAEDSIAHFTELGDCSAPTTEANRDYLGGVDGDEHEITTWDCPGGDMQLWTGVGGDHVYFSTNDAYKADLAAWLTE